jgi:hypothetical protein
MTLLPRGKRIDRRDALRAFAVGITRLASPFVLGSAATCENLDNFDVEVDAQAMIPAGTIIDELIDKLNFTELQSIDLTQELANQGVTKDDVDSVRMIRFSISVRMIRFSISIVGPAGANFDFLEAVSFFVETDDQPRLLVAKLDPVPAGATTIELVTQPNVELVPYVVAPKMRMIGEVTGKRPPQDTTVSALVVLDVDVRVTGC